MDNIFIFRASSPRRLLTFHSRRSYPFLDAQRTIVSIMRHNHFRGFWMNIFLLSVIWAQWYPIYDPKSCLMPYSTIIITLWCSFQLEPKEYEIETDWRAGRSGRHWNVSSRSSPEKHFSRIEFRWRGEFTFEVRAATESNYPFVCSLQPAVRRRRMKSVESIGVLFAIEEKPITIVPSSRRLSDSPTAEWRSKMRGEKNVARE